MNSPTLILSSIHKSYTQAGSMVPILQGVTASFEYGQSYAITGISGSGKSTLVYILAGLDAPAHGTILYNGQDINQFNQAQKAHFLNHSIGLAFQYPYLIKELTVLENVMVKGMIGNATAPECRQNALELLDQVGLADHADYFPGQLSGGQQQRVALARALMNNPAFLIADEPTANLDAQTGTMIFDLIMRLQQERGMGVIISSHDQQVIGRMMSVYQLKDGLLTLKK